jgi:hypothetical protein
MCLSAVSCELHICIQNENILHIPMRYASIKVASTVASFRSVLKIPIYVTTLSQLLVENG